MEKRRRKDKGVSSSPQIGAKKLSSEVTFESFFVKCVREGKLREWQRLEIAAFFRDLKLREKEDLEVFEESLKKY